MAVFCLNAYVLFSNSSMFGSKGRLKSKEDTLEGQISALEGQIYEEEIKEDTM